MRVLMAIDASPFSETVCQAVVAQFRRETTEILILHVLQPISPSAPPQMAAAYAPELDDQKKEAHALVERISKELRGNGFPVRAAVEVGEIRGRIIDAADDWHADLIVVGSHGQRGIQRFLLGSVAESVARHAHCSVQIVRTAGGPGNPSISPK
jgi:nucleotide-binding universal stress UspA family protein